MTEVFVSVVVSIPPAVTAPQYPGGDGRQPGAVPALLPAALREVEPHAVHGAHYVLQLLRLVQTSTGQNSIGKSLYSPPQQLRTQTPLKTTRPQPWTFFFFFIVEGGECNCRRKKKQKKKSRKNIFIQVYFFPLNVYKYLRYFIFCILFFFLVVTGLGRAIPANVPKRLFGFIIMQVLLYTYTIVYVHVLGAA